MAEWHGRIAQAILRNWEMSEEVVIAVAAAENLERDHEGTTDLADVLAVGGALASLGPDPRAEEMLFLGMPAARRMKLDARMAAAPRWPNPTRKSRRCDRHWAHELPPKSTSTVETRAMPNTVVFGFVKALAAELSQGAGRAAVRARSRRSSCSRRLSDENVVE